MKKQRFHERSAVITGASRGIGRATAIVLAREGADLLLHGRDETALNGLQQELNIYGGNYAVCIADLGQPGYAEKIVRSAQCELGRIDVLINNCGGGVAKQPFHELPVNQLQKVYQLNLESVFLLTQQVIPVMLKQQYGRIVNVASLAGRKYSPLACADYTMAKAGLIGLTRQLAMEYASQGIGINAAAPGITLSERIVDRWNQKTDEQRKQIVSETPMGRPAQLEEVALPIAFLASDEAAYITGHTLDINGGAMMN
ncbi:MAG: SDR family oxidoreductase [Verrucomicrobiota bacterium]